MHTCFLNKDRKGVYLDRRGREEDLRGVGVMENHNQDALFETNSFSIGKKIREILNNLNMNLKAFETKSKQVQKSVEREKEQ